MDFIKKEIEDEYTFEEDVKEENIVCTETFPIDVKKEGKEDITITNSSVLDIASDLSLQSSSTKWYEYLKDNDEEENSDSDIEAETKSLENKVKKCTYTDCPYLTLIGSRLKQHINRVHLKNKSFKCLNCGHKCYNQQAMIDHVKRIHLNLNKEICNLCEFSCNDRSIMKRHKLNVYSKLYYTCDKCDYAIDTKTEFLEHMHQFHSEKNLQNQLVSVPDVNDVSSEEPEVKINEEPTEITATKPNDVKKKKTKGKIEKIKDKTKKCQYCSYTCTTNYHLKKHENTHLRIKNQECPHCDHKSYNKNEIKYHIKRTHSNKIKEKFLEECNLCDYFDTTKLKIVNHQIQKHPYLTRYSCFLCDYKNPSKNHLMVHFATHHSKKSEKSKKSSLS